MLVPAHRLGIALVSLLVMACDGDPAPPTAASLAPVSGPNATTPAGSTTDAVVRALDADGAPVAGVVLTARVTAGGGALAATRLTTDADGRATARWTVGVAPVANALSVEAGDAVASFTTRATVDPAAEAVPLPFGDVNAWLTAAGRDGSTEGLAFSADKSLVIGVPGGLAVVAPDGTVRDAAVTGTPLVGPLGLAQRAAGGFWVCDGEGGALVAVSGSGAATPTLEADGEDELLTPNSVAVGPDGLVYLTDSCLGRIFQLDPASGAITARLALDRTAVGGPNGLAFDDAGQLWFTTENTGFLCAHGDVGVTDSLAGLYRVTVAPGQFGPPTPVAEGVALFGDGLAFDSEGNLFTIFDTVDGFALDESIVFVLPRGGDALVRFFGVRGQVLANLAFGVGAYGEQTLYFTLLAVPPFTPAEARGVMSLPVGLRGRPLP